jgi:hypothetical protein
MMQALLTGDFERSLREAPTAVGRAPNVRARHQRSTAQSRRAFAYSSSILMDGILLMTTD